MHADLTTTFPSLAKGSDTEHKHVNVALSMCGRLHSGRVECDIGITDACRTVTLEVKLSEQIAIVGHELLGKIVETRPFQ